MTVRYPTAPRGDDVERLPPGVDLLREQIGRRRQDIKAEAHNRNPEPGDPERRARAQAELDAYVAGYHLKELRTAIGMTQAEVARILGASQSHVSRIENGDLEAMELETLRAYAAALGGHVDVTVNVGPYSIKVA